MRILKYIALLILLVLVASTILVATLRPDFNIVRTKIINTPKSSLFNYVNDYKNWADFGSWKQDDPSMTIKYGAVTSGKGASYTWKGNDGNGKMQTISVKDNDSIYQKMDYNGTLSEVFWSFKDTLGKTKVTWRTKGKMSFGFKIYCALQGGIDNIVGTMYERSLTNIDKTLDYEINTYNIQVNGVVQKSVGFYMQKTINSKNENVTSNIQIMITNMVHFFEKNKIIQNGKPFVQYNSFDNNLKTTNFSVGIPIKDEIYTSSGSEILAGNLAPFEAIKTTLTGDYSHINAAKNKTLNYISQNNLTEDKTFPYLEVYVKTKADIKSPSKWITELYIPVKAKVTYKKANQTSTTTDITAPSVPATTVPEP